MQAKSFLILFFLGLLAALLFVALLNFRVDPLSVFSGEQRDPQLMSRIEQFPHMRLSKPWILRRLKPEALIVGSSRSGTMPPGFAGWEGSRAYNTAVPGMTSHEMLYFVEHALAQGHLQKLMLGLDFATFIIGEMEFREGFSRSRMMRTAGDSNSLDFRLQQGIDLRNTLFTYATFGKSLLALTGGEQKSRIYYPDGSWRNHSKLLTGRPGYVYVGRNHRALEAVRKPGLETSLENLRHTLDRAYSEGLDTRLVITPVHVFTYRLWGSLERAEEWLRFHQGVLRINRELALEYGARAYPVLGFNTEAGIVDEPIRGRLEDPGQAWFLDGVHSTRRLGELMMKASWTAGTGIGVLLTEDNLPQYLQEIEALAQEFEQNNADLTGDLRFKIFRD